MSRTVVGAIGLTVLIGASSVAWAGGHGAVFHPGGPGSGGFHTAHAMPPVSGTWHVRTGRSFITGAGQPHPGFGYGHTNTAFGVGRGYGSPGGLHQTGYFGHTRTEPNGSERWQTARVVPTSGYGRGGVGYGHGVYAARFGVRYGHYPRLVTGRSGYGRSGYPGYGYAGYGSIGSYGAAPAYSTDAGYAMPTLATQYSEPPLNYGGSEPADYGVGGSVEGSRSLAGVGGPQVIVVNNNYAAGCHCRAGSQGPVVYRYGVGTYY